MSYVKICRQQRCNRHVEVYGPDEWSDQCRTHNDEDDDRRQEYREDAAREDREYAADRQEDE